MIADVSLEQLFTGQGFAGIPASPLQRGFLRAADGVASGLSAEMCLRHFGCEELAALLPAIVVAVCGIRGGKSFMACVAAIRCVFRVDLRKAQRHEIARVAIVSVDLDAAEATFRILRGIIEGSPLLAACVVGTPTTDTIVLRRPDGRCIEIVVVAASRGGSHLRSRWLAGAIIDEAALIGTDATGAAVSAEQLFNAAKTRLLPGGQVWVISSPFGPQGLLHALWKKHYGKPGRTLVLWAGTRDLNPAFPQSTIDEIAEQDPDTAAREYLAQWLDAVSSLLEASSIDTATRTDPIVRPLLHGIAAMDAGTRGNAWTLATGALIDGKVVVGGVWEWKGSKSHPLSPKAVLKEIASILIPQNIREVWCDGWGFDGNQDHAIDAGISLSQFPSGEVQGAYSHLKTQLSNDAIELPPVPQVRADLLGLRKRAASGGVRVELSKTADGRHCDSAPPIAIVTWKAKHNATPNVTATDVLEMMGKLGRGDDYTYAGGIFGR